MFRKILISTCVILYLNFVNCYSTDKKLHALYEKRVIITGNNTKDKFSLCNYKNIWVSICECAYKKLRENDNAYEEAHLSYNLFGNKTNNFQCGKVTIQLKNKYLKSYKSGNIDQNIAPCYGRRIVIPFGTDLKQEDLYDHIVIFVLPDSPHDAVVFRKNKVGELYSLFDWIKENTIKELWPLENNDRISLYEDRYSLDGTPSQIFRFVTAISYNEEATERQIIERIESDKSDYKRQNRGCISCLKPSFKPGYPWFTYELNVNFIHFIKRESFANLCRLALRRSKYPEFSVDVKTMKETSKPLIMKAEVSIGEYKINVPTYPCTGYKNNEYTGEEKHPTLDNTTYVLSRGLDEMSIIVYKNISNSTYKIVEMITNIDETYIRKIYGKT